jgi:isopenicillin N synthase-like dioxygenase
VLSPDGWTAAPPVPGSFVCNIGDMLDRMTGGRYRSTPHRVVNRSGRDRYTFPLFLDPGWDAAVAPIPLGDATPADDGHTRWDGASVHEVSGTYGEYLLAKVSKVFPDLVTEVL